MENILINIMVGLGVLFAVTVVGLGFFFFAIPLGVLVEKIVAKIKHDRYYEMEYLPGLACGFGVEILILILAYFIGSLF